MREIDRTEARRENLFHSKVESAACRRRGNRIYSKKREESLKLENSQKTWIFSRLIVVKMLVENEKYTKSTLATLSWWWYSLLTTKTSRRGESDTTTSKLRRRCLRTEIWALKIHKSKCQGLILNADRNVWNFSMSSQSLTSKTWRILSLSLIPLQYTLSTNGIFSMLLGEVVKSLFIQNSWNSLQIALRFRGEEFCYSKVLLLWHDDAIDEESSII